MAVFTLTKRVTETVYRKTIEAKNEEIAIGLAEQEAEQNPDSDLFELDCNEDWVNEDE